MNVRLHNFKRRHPGRKVSLRSVKSWAEKLNEAGGNIDALVDGNDGMKQRGDHIPATAKRMFRDEYLRSHRPNIALIYGNVIGVAKVKGWGAMPSYDTFWRYATKRLPKLVRRLLRDNADTPRAALPHVRRDPTSIGAYHTIQADHREIDVPVRCDKGCAICTGKKPKGHFPIWTAFIDIRSRRILGSEISIETPTSNVILGVFRRIVDEEGLPRRVYLDNGSDFRKAFGKRLRKAGRTEWDGPSEERLQARFAPVGVEVIFALPYNAQAKAIERMFRTFRQRFDENFEAYRGALGEKRVCTRAVLPAERIAGHFRTRVSSATRHRRIQHDAAQRPWNGAGSVRARLKNFRTPDDVFFDPAIRTPRREPDESFAYLFFNLVDGGRVVGNNGVQVEGRIYRLVSLQKHLEFWGERVDVRVNPDDQRVAMIFDLRALVFGQPFPSAIGVLLRHAQEVFAVAEHACDELTRHFIACVVRGILPVNECLADVRARPLVEYLKRRARENDAARGQRRAGLTTVLPVTVIGSLSAVARGDEAAQSILPAPSSKFSTRMLQPRARATSARRCRERRCVSCPRASV